VDWENGARLVKEMGDPDDIWAKITSCTKEEWESKFKELRLHRYPNAHNRAWRIGKDMCARYDGDARKIWEGRDASDALYRLWNLGAGEQISRMIVGALRDTHQVKGVGDVKADLHVCRVLGRVFSGDQVHAAAATELARDFNPSDPWQFDSTIWNVGISFCHTTEPNCSKCYLAPACSYALQHLQSTLEPN
jgi:hypothetical protein